MPIFEKHAVPGAHSKHAPGAVTISNIVLGHGWLGKFFRIIYKWSRTIQDHGSGAFGPGPYVEAKISIKKKKKVLPLVRSFDLSSGKVVWISRSISIASLPQVTAASPHFKFEWISCDIVQCSNIACVGSRPTATQRGTDFMADHSTRAWWSSIDEVLRRPTRDENKCL